MRKLHKKPLVLAAAAIALTGSLTVGSARHILRHMPQRAVVSR